MSQRKKKFKLQKIYQAQDQRFFLETRACVGHALSTLFDLDTLEISINTYPGKPQSLPSGIGI